MQIKNFMCFKVKDKEEGSNKPDYRLTAIINDEMIDIGAGWIKEGKSGKFISFTLKDAYQDRPAFVITTTDPVVESGEDDGIGF